MLALGLFSYLKLSSTIEAQAEQSDIPIMNQMNGNIEQVLKTLDYSLNRISDSSVMQDVLYRSMTYMDFQLYNDLRREFGHLQSLDMKVTDVLLVNASESWVINNRGLYGLDQFPEKDHLLSFFSLPYNSNWILHKNGELGSRDTQSYTCSNTIVLVKKLPLNGSDKRALVFAHIPVCSLAKMMGEETDTRHVMILDENYRIVAHPNEDLIGKSVLETGYMKETDLERITEHQGQFTSEAKSASYSVTYSRSEFTKWTYVSFTELGELKKASRPIGWFTLYTCLAIIAVSLGFVVLGSRRMYTPVQGIVKAITDSLPVRDAARGSKHRSEFQMIEDFIQNLFASNSSLKSELERHTQQVSVFFLINLFSGKVPKHEIEDRLEQYGYLEQIQNWGRLAVLTLEIDSIEDTKYGASDYELLMFAVNNIVEECIPPQSRLTPVVVDRTQATLVGFSGMDEEAFDSHLYQLTELIQKNVRLFLDLDVSIGISLPFTSPRHARRAYREGQEALMQRLKLGKGIIVPYANLNAGKHTLIFSYPKHLQNELIDSIKLADEERAHALLKQWLDEVLGKERSPQDDQISLIRLLNDLMIVMQESGIQLEATDPQGRSVHEELLQLYVSQEIEAWFRGRILAPMLQVFRDRRDSQYHNLSEQMIDMIQKEFDTDLTLEECASRLHYNAFYLSNVFKRETDMTFSEYLSMYRFQMARKWLTETDLPVKDIASRLRYTNPQNFIRSFRKHEDMTPGQYRAKYSAPGL
ncbi:putative HTH-type transcriptional regulator YtdP [Paenibacillus sp. J31TS4]|nr:putative HTH-type transcriptional regulator YtdP [Paenibacillus sp. J31TS4]